MNPRCRAAQNPDSPVRPDGDEAGPDEEIESLALAS